jgi:dTDP-glucose pyrophosphorylase
MSRKKQQFFWYSSGPRALSMGVVEFDENKKSIEYWGKPLKAKTTMLWNLIFYPNSVIEIVRNVNPAIKLEITTANQEYVARNLGKLSWWEEVMPG